MFKYILAVVMAITFVPAAHALTEIDRHLYSGYTGEEITVAWNHHATYQEGDKYEIQLYNPERDLTRTLVLFASGTEYTFSCNRTGHWIVRIRSVRQVNHDTPAIYEYSEWATSIEVQYATVDGVARGWWIFTWIQPTGPIEPIGR